MKPVLYSILFILFPANVFSQLNVRASYREPVKCEALDNSVLRVFYETIFVNDVNKPRNTEIDLMALEIGEKGISRYYSENRRKTDSVMNEQMKNGTTVRFELNSTTGKAIPSLGDTREVYKNYPSGKISVTERISDSNYLYEEDKNIFQWQIESDTREILSYTCKKAVTGFRGRLYEVWFAPELPYNDGPWKFSGLPGLILAVRDSDNNFVFQAVRIEKTKLPVEFPQDDYKKVSRREVSGVLKQYHEDPTEYLLKSYPRASVTIKTIDEEGVEKTGNDVKYPYNPIELD